MNKFKFLSKDNKVTYRTPIEYLKEYLRRLDCNYCSQFNIFNETSPLWVPSNNLYSRVMRYIESEQLTSFEEVRRYLYFCYRDMVEGIHEIKQVDDGTHITLVNEVCLFMTQRVTHENI